MALNAKQLRFVELFQASVLAGKPNATQAYMQAYGQTDAKIAKVCAAKLLTKANVQQLLQPAQRTAEVARVEVARGIEITRDRIRLEMARLSFVDPRKLFRPDGTMVPVHELDADTAAAVASVEVEERFEGDDDGVTVRTRKVKFWDKNRALQTLADTEPGVWADDAKGRGDTTNNVTVNLVNLTDGDLDQLDALLARAESGPHALAPAPAAAVAGAGPGGEGPAPAQ